MLTKEQMDALPVLLADATPGPWAYEYTRLGHTVRQSPDSARALMVVNCAEIPETDGRLIALTPTLATTVIEQKVEIERLREALRLIVEEEPTSDIWVGHYGIRAIKLHAKDALGAAQ